MSSHWSHWKATSSLWALAVWNWGDKSEDLPYIWKFELTCHVMLCFTEGVFLYYTDISLYLPISSLFQMSSHWLHWKAKSSLWALAVWNWGGGVNLKIYPKSENLSSPAIWCFASQVFLYYTYISLYLPISWLFQMSSHWLHWKAKSSLWALAVWNWGG